MLNCLLGCLLLACCGNVYGQAAYAINSNFGGTKEIGSVNLCTGDWTFIAALNPQPNRFAGGGEIIDGLYYSVTTDGDIVQIDVATGATTVLLSVPGAVFSGLDTDPTTGNLYAISISCGVSTSLYQIDLSVPSATLVGTDTNIGCGIWIVCTPTGQAYVADLTTNAIYPIDLMTGMAAGPGVPIVDAALNPIDIDFGQEMEFQGGPVSGQVYGYLFDEDKFQGSFGTIDLQSGIYTKIRDYPTGFNLGSFALGTIPKIPYTWIGEISTAWNGDCNWNTGRAPGADNPVIIPAGTPNAPVLQANTTYAARALTLQSGVQLALPATSGFAITDTLLIDNATLLNEGMLDPGSTALQNGGTLTNRGRVE